MDLYRLKSRRLRKALSPLPALRHENLHTGDKRGVGAVGVLRGSS
jgi:hypothetical protein